MLGDSEDAGRDYNDQPLSRAVGTSEREVRHYRRT
jgi:hypothetical protein